MICGSGGFTSYWIPELQKQMGDWAAQGIKMVKMKIGREPVLGFRGLKRVRRDALPTAEVSKPLRMMNA